jgi:hypothetical protein
MYVTIKEQPLHFQHKYRLLPAAGFVPELDMRESKHFLLGQFVNSVPTPYILLQFLGNIYFT